MDVDDNVAEILLSSGSSLVILGGAKDRTGENHASAFSPLKHRARIQEQESTFGTMGTYKIRGLSCGQTSFKLHSFGLTNRRDAICHK